MNDPAAELDCYLVGGAVRDRLLGHVTYDRDWVVIGTTAEEMRTLGFEPVGQDFPVFLHPQTHEQYALARRERKVSPGYRGFEVDTSIAVTLQEDLSRRDLTINAMAQNRDGTLVDPWGGAKDLQQRQLRHVSDAFAEDPVRILRVARFAARYAALRFTVAEETLTLMRKMVRNGEVDALIPERVWQEMRTALAEDQPRRFFEILHECRALERVLPELQPKTLQHVTLPTQHRLPLEMNLDALEHGSRLSGSKKIRFAALLHSLGTATTDSASVMGQNDNTAPLRAVCERLRVPTTYRKLATMVANHYTLVGELDERAPQEILALLQSLDAFRKPQQGADFGLACQAVLQAHGEHAVAAARIDYLQRCLQAALGVNLSDLSASTATGEARRLLVYQRRSDAISRVDRKAS